MIPTLQANRHLCTAYCTDTTYVWVDLAKSAWWTMKPEIKDVVWKIGNIFNIPRQNILLLRMSNTRSLHV